MRRVVLCPSTALYLVFGGTFRYFVLAVAYLGLQSFFFDPNGILVWSFLVAAVLGFAVLFSHAILRTRRLMRPVTAARRRYDAFEPGAEFELRTALKRMRQKQRIGPLLLAFSLLVVALTPIVPLSLWRDMQEPLVQSPIHPRPYSPRAELRKVLTSMERHGVFTFGHPDQ